MSWFEDMHAWAPDLGLRSLIPNPALPADHLTRIERRLGRRLPASYRSFLGELDGGRFPRFYLDGTPSDAEVHSFTQHDQASFLGLFDEMRLPGEMPVDLLPVGADGAGGIYGLLLPEHEAPDSEWLAVRCDGTPATLQPLGWSFAAVVAHIVLEQRHRTLPTGYPIPSDPDAQRTASLAVARGMLAVVPDAPYAQLVMADEAARAGRGEEALALAEGAAAAAPELATVWERVALLRAHQGDVRGAARAAARAFQGRPYADGPRPLAWPELKRLLLVGGIPEDLIGAASPLAAFLRSENALDDAQARVSLALALAHTGDLPGANRQIEAAMLWGVSDDLPEQAGLQERWFRARGLSLQADLARRDANMFLDMTASMSATLDSLNAAWDDE